MRFLSHKNTVFLRPLSKEEMDAPYVPPTYTPIRQGDYVILDISVKYAEAEAELARLELTTTYDPGDYVVSDQFDWKSFFSSGITHVKLADGIYEYNKWGITNKVELNA